MKHLGDIRLPLTLAVGLVLAHPGVARATSLIDPGWDLFETQVGTTFFFAPIPSPQIVDFEGIPLSCFDFGDGNGCVDVGNTDTIVERVDPADLGGGSDTIDIEIVALSLTSVSPVDLGFGAGFEDIFIDLNTSSPSLQSNMTITSTGEAEPHGTFDSVLNFSFDVSGSIGGFYGTFEKTLTATGVDWQHAPTGTVVINGINRLLNGSDGSNDFWADGLVVHDDGTETAIHRVVAATPEPGPAVLVGLGLGVLAMMRARFEPLRAGAHSDSGK